MAFLFQHNMMQVETYPLGEYQANCYLIWQNDHVLIVDPGTTSKKIVSHIQDNNGVVDAILLTHGHFDHMGGVDFFQKEFNCPVYLSNDEMSFLTNTNFNRSEGRVPLQVHSKVLAFDAQMSIQGFTFDVIEAPGHTDGSVLFVFDSFVISGDVLFNGSIGRCDLPTGSMNKMTRSLEKIKSLNPNLIVYPGHGPNTTIENELKNNPYLQK